MFKMFLKAVMIDLPLYLVLFFSRRFRVYEFNVAIFLQNPVNRQCLLDKTARALELICLYAPEKFKLIKNYIKHILIFGGHGSLAQYDEKIKLCDISRKFALAQETTSAHLAMVLIHEAMHGYLDSHGVAYHVKRRSKIERICVRAELVFASRLPHSDELVDDARKRLDYGEEFWSNDAFLQRELLALEKFGFPNWIIKFAKKRIFKNISKK